MFLCKKGLWKRKCPKYLVEKKKTGGSTSSSRIFDIHGIDVFLTSSKSNSWVFDTRSITNICNTMQGLPKVRKIEKDEVLIRVGNGA